MNVNTNTVDVSKGSFLLDYKNVNKSSGSFSYIEMIL